MKKLILASQSKYRKDLLKRLGVPFECIPANIDEQSFKNKIDDPVELAKTLAYHKAKHVFDLHPNNTDIVVIGSDQVAYIDNKVLGKTGSLDKSIQQLQLLRGKTHQLITAYCILSAKKRLDKVNTTTLHMKPLSDLQIKKYLSYDIPFDCAGSYKLESYGISLFEKIDTDDYTAIIGLPLIELGIDLCGFEIKTPPE